MISIQVGQATITLEADSEEHRGSLIEGGDAFKRTSVTYEQAIEDALHALSRTITATVGENDSGATLLFCINEMRFAHGDYRAESERRRVHEQVQRAERERREEAGEGAEETGSASPFGGPQGTVS